MLVCPPLFQIQRAADFAGTLTNGYVLAWNASAGKFELIAAPSGLPGSAAQGDILYQGASSAAWLAPGATVGGFVKTGGTGANPSVSTVTSEDSNGALHLQAAKGTVVALGSQSTAATVNCNSGTDFTLTTTGTCAVTVSNLAAGQKVILFVTQGSGGSHTITLTSFKVSGGGGGVVTLSTAAGAIDRIVLSNDGTNNYADVILNYT
jgi:hypothetical protein